MEASGKVASLRACFTEVKTEATALWARVKWLKRAVDKPDELLSALVCRSCFGPPPPPLLGLPS